ncbi:MAG: hypothetical protein ABH874_01520 [Methanobacteriota archaeon]|nr:hypothetical protein [Candidatus Hydrothermarchaeota archaeon]
MLDLARSIAREVGEGSRDVKSLAACILILVEEIEKLKQKN